VSSLLVITINVTELMWIRHMELFAVGNGVFAINRSHFPFVFISKAYICNNLGKHIRAVVL
jgi:hypothetical protein